MKPIELSKLQPKVEGKILYRQASMKNELNDIPSLMKLSP